MESLSPNRIAHTRSNGVDKVYIQLQEKSELPNFSTLTEGYVFYNEDFHWIGVEFSLEGNKSTVLFDPASKPIFKEGIEFSIERNENGIHGIECINGIINGIGRNHPFVQ